MHEAAKDLRFEYAARLRDEVQDLRKELQGDARGRRRASEHPPTLRGGPRRPAQLGSPA